MHKEPTKYFIAQLIYKSITEIISKEEKAILEDWLCDADNRKLFNKITIDKENIINKRAIYNELDTASRYSKFEEKIAIDDDKPFIERTLPFLRVFKYAAAIIVFLGAGYYIYQQNYFSGNIKSTISEEKITLQHANGHIETINEDGSSSIVDEHGDVIGSQNGSQLVYSNDAVLETLVYNTLTVPYGKRFEITLSDGTTVNLNAGTSLKYPVKFINGEDRRVFLEGEAFFKVSSDANHPFVVNANELDVRVLGTQFNVTSYPEDDAINTVLVEGSVNVYNSETDYNPQMATQLTPGFMALWEKSSNEISVEVADIEMHTAWIKGKIIFRHISLDHIFKKLERHYNVEIINNNKSIGVDLITTSFDIETIDQVFKVINELHPLNYNIDNNQIIIN